MSDSSIIQNVISALGGGGAVVLVVVWALRNLAKVEKFAAWFYSAFGWISEKLEYGKVAMKVQSAVNAVGEKINKESPGVLPHAMKIEWEKDAKSVEASLRNGEIIVMMDYSRNRERNLVVATLAYLGKGLLPFARSYVDPILVKSTDFTVAKNIFVSSGQHVATQYFFENYLKPEVGNNPQIEEYCEILDLLGDKGFFTRIYLRELKVLGDKIYPATPTSVASKESVDFVQFLHRIASKQRGIDVPGGLFFTGSKIRVNVMLIARQKTLARSGLKTYQRRIELCRNMGIEYLYVLGTGRDNVFLADYIAKEAEGNGALLIIESQRFRVALGGKDYNAICILCTLRVAKPSVAYGDIEIIVNLLEEYISEIAEGKIEIVYVSRSPGVMSKVVVNSLSDDIDAVALCREPNKMSAMQFALGGESLDFVKWSEQPESLIVSSLYPLKPEQVVGVIVDSRQKNAVVKVRDSEARVSALGYGNINLKLAMELTGYNIKIEVAE